MTPGQWTTEAVMKALQGKWRVVYSELNGEMTAVDDFSTIVLENKDNKFFVEKRGSVAYEGRFSINVSVMPHEIVYIYTKAPNDVFLGGPRAGILQLAGYTLKTCLGAIGQRPPTDFSTFPDSQAVLAVHQRLGEDGKGLGAHFIPPRVGPDLVW
jgi:uncharacterized protein (TIGR03067 family)